MAERRNLVLDPRPVSTDMWQGSSATELSSVTDGGEPALAVRIPDAPAVQNNVSARPSQFALDTPAQSGRWFACSWEVRALDEHCAQDMRIVVTNINGDGTQAVFGTPVTLGGYTRIYAAVQMDSNDGYYAPQAWPANNSTDPRVGFNVRRAMAAIADTQDEALAMVSGYFDGDSPERVVDGVIYRYAWEDQPHASPSTETALARGWHEITDEGVVAAGEAYADAVGGQPLLAELQRITPQGLWVPVGQVPPSQHATADVTDVLAPYGQVTAYRARAVTVLDDQRLVSGWSVSDPVTPVSRHSYLAAAADPLRTWVKVLIGEDGPHVHQRPVEVAYGLGDTEPRVSYGRRRGRTGSITLNALTHDDSRALAGLLHAGEPLVLRWPAELEDLGPDYVDAGQLVFDVASEIETSRLAQYVIQRRRVTFTWVEQTATIGAGGTAAPITHPIAEVVEE